MIRLKGILSTVGNLKGVITSEQSLCGSLSLGGFLQLPYYSGIYTVTPSNEGINLETANKAMESNVTIKPIPNNYGLITYNGSYIMVS